MRYLFHKFLLLLCQNAHATSQCYQDWVPVSTRVKAKRQPLSSKVSSQQSQILNSLKSARATAANVPRKLTHHLLTNKRTEPSQSADQSKSLRTSTCKRTDRLQSNLTEEPKRTPSARETMPRVVLELDLAAPLLARAQHPSAATEPDIEYMSRRQSTIRLLSNTFPISYLLTTATLSLILT